MRNLFSQGTRQVADIAKRNGAGGPSRRLLLASLALAFFPLAAAEADIAVVVRSDTPVDNLTFADLRRLLRGERQFWTSNLKVTLLVRAPVARERDIILNKIYQMSEAQFRQYWIAKVFRAEAAAGPRIVYSNEMSAELVNAIPGAVALVDSSEIPKGLKALKIDGLLPGEKGYPLH